MVQQGLDPPHQAHIIPLVGVLQAPLHGFDGLTRQLYPDVHGCSLLHWVCQSHSEEIHPSFISRQSPLPLFVCPRAFSPAAQLVLRASKPSGSETASACGTSPSSSILRRSTTSQ